MDNLGAADSPLAAQPHFQELRLPQHSGVGLQELDHALHDQGASLGVVGSQRAIGKQMLVSG